MPSGSVEADQLSPTELDVTVGTVGGWVSVLVTTSSYAPTSHPDPCGRAMPRWSVPPEHPVTLGEMTSSAGLPGASAIVCVGPPFDARASRWGAVFGNE